METTTSIKAAIRSAESDRLATCQLADRIARVSIDTYRRNCPDFLSSSIKQTVISTIVAQLPGRNEDGSDTKLIVVSLGQGTKVVNYHHIVDTRKCSMASGLGDSIVRDCHAEVLARRGLLAYLYVVLDNSSTDDSIHLFERSENNKLQLISGVKLHLYTSSQPCGNATMKKWAKSSRPTQYLELNPDEYPTEVHSKIQINSRSAGQVAVLVKKNNHKTDGTSRDASLKSVNYEFPIGTSPTDRGEGNVMTCSDKIAKWNALGLQGALLSQFFEPLYLSTITVGRKFSRVHCERALCCRLQGFCYPCINDGANGFSGSDNIQKPKKPKLFTVGSSSSVKFMLHHPVMMSTAAKLDEGAIITAKTSNVDSVLSDETTCGAEFSDFRSFCMWQKAADITKNMWNQEILDGRTGKVHHELSDKITRSKEDEDISQLSSYSLGLNYQSRTKCMRSYYDCKRTHCELSEELNEYTQAKMYLTTHKDFFPEWIRKL